MISQERQNEVRALVEPIVDEMLARLVRSGIRPHEAAQLLVLTGAGLLAGSLGPKHAGFELREVAGAVSGWMQGLASTVEKRL